MARCVMGIAPGIDVHFYYDKIDDEVEIESVMAGGVDITDWVPEEKVLERMYQIREEARWEHMMGADRDD